MDKRDHRYAAQCLQRGPPRLFRLEPQLLSSLLQFVLVHLGLSLLEGRAKPHAEILQRRRQRRSGHHSCIGRCSNDTAALHVNGWHTAVPEIDCSGIVGIDKR